MLAKKKKIWLAIFDVAEKFLSIISRVYAVNLAICIRYSIVDTGSRSRWNFACSKEIHPSNMYEFEYWI